MKNKNLTRIRTITTFISLTKDKSKWATKIIKASQFCTLLSEEFIANAYTVQSVRIVTNPFGEYLNTDSLEKAKEDLVFLSEILKDSNQSGIRIRFAIGEAKNQQEIELLPELIKDFQDLCNACINVGKDEFGVLDNELIEISAKAIQKISKITPRGEGNFNFTVNFNCPSFIPYFPASYHRNEHHYSFVIGLETPDLLLKTLKDYNQKNPNQSLNTKYPAYFQNMKQALQEVITDIDTILRNTSIDEDFTFLGFDSSAAPSKNCSSIVEIYKEMGVEFFGSSGTVEASALLTNVFKSIENINLVGFSGLMLAVTEDKGLAQGSIDSDFDIRALLTYSAVCGIGLDTVPIPGNTSIEKISALMRDTGTMAFRLNKPLTVRLFPVPNLSAGEMTVFESDDLCNCAVLCVL